MKIFLDILRYLLSMLLALSILVVFACNIALSTVFSEEYMYSKLKQSHYYEKVYLDFYNNCLKYFKQSGLDGKVFYDICDISKIEQDVNKIIKNVYQKSDETIEVESIRNKLEKNINDYLQENKLQIENSESISDFENIICDEYIVTIFHTKYEVTINDYIQKYKKLITNVSQYIKYVIIVVSILIVIVNIKAPKRIISMLGMSILFMSLSILYLRYSFVKNIDVSHILVVSDAFSDVIKMILNEILNILDYKGKVFGSIGIILVIFGNIIQYKKSEKNSK